MSHCKTNILNKFPIINASTQPKYQRTVSAGYLKELTYILLATTLLRVERELEKGLVSKDGVHEINLPYDKQKQLARRIKNIEDEMIAFTMLNGDVVEKVRKKKDDLFLVLMEEIQGTDINLAYLSMSILLLRFQKHERDKPLHKDFNWLSKKDSQLIAIMDIINSSKDALDIEKTMYQIADNLTKRL